MSLSASCVVGSTSDASASSVLTVGWRTPASSEPGGTGLRSTFSPCTGMKSIDVSPPSRPWTRVGCSLWRMVYWCSIWINTRTSPVSSSRVTRRTSPTRTPERRTGVPCSTPGASAKRTTYSCERTNSRGKLPNRVMSTASSSSPASTNTPMRKRNACSFMGGPPQAHGLRPVGFAALRPVPRQLAQAVARLALDELAHARVGAARQLVGRAVEDHLRLARLEARQRVEHHHAVGHLRHHHAGHRVTPPRLQDQLVDDVSHDRVEAGGRLVVEHDLGVEGQRPRQA